MDFSIPAEISKDLIRYRDMIKTHVRSQLTAWNKNREIPRDFFQTLGAGGWLLNGTKSYVTNGAIADFGVITAVSDPEAPRSGRLSMFLVDHNHEGVRRKKLNKQVWIPSDLTR